MHLVINLYIYIDSTKQSVTRGISSSKYWRALRPSAPNLGKLRLKVPNRLQLKCHLERNAFSNFVLESEVNLWKCVCGDDGKYEAKEKCITSSLPKSGDRTLHYFGDTLA
jgi:hypothetical protein